MSWRNSRFRSRSSRIWRWAMEGGAYLAVIAFLANTSCAADSLPWVKDFATAREIAIREGKPLFVMMTATWCGPCKQLEQNTLPQKVVRSALRDFVWVQSFEDRMIENKYRCGGYPTLAFVDPATDQVFSRTTGYQPVGPFLRDVIEARRAGKLGLDPDLEAMAAKVFTPNPMKIQEFIAANDGKGLKEYLLPASQDVLRNSNFALLKISLPDDVPADEVTVLGSRAEYPFTPSGLFCVQVRVAEPAAKVQVIAPGCRVEEFEVPFSKAEAVATRVVSIKKLTAKDTARLAGRVVLPNGRPASEAIVRICDVAWVQADKRGQYEFDKLPAGVFQVRVECPGGELQERIFLAAGKPMKKDWMVKPVATVGIRWSLQMETDSPKLTGDRLRTGQAHFSVAHGRFSLARGAEVRNAWGSDLMLADDVARFANILTAAQRDAIMAEPPPRIFFWLFDSSGRGNGLHLESKKFDEIEEVNDGNPIAPQSYFKFLRGEPLKVGQVYTVYCCAEQRYAKLEITHLSPPAGTAGR